MHDQTPVVVEGDDIDAVDSDPFDLILELQHRAALPMSWARPTPTFRASTPLGTSIFLARAPEKVVEGEREKRKEAEQRRAKIREALDRLKAAA
jgi:hypothetical protein